MTRYLIGDKFIAMPYASYIIGILTITIRTISVPDSLRDSVGEHVGEMARLWRLNMARRLQTHGLSFPQWAVLRTLAGRGDGMVQRDLADAIGVDGSTLVGILDRLAKAELVERRENAQDRRFKRVHLGPRPTRCCRSWRRSISVFARNSTRTFPKTISRSACAC